MWQRIENPKTKASWISLGSPGRQTLNSKIWLIWWLIILGLAIAWRAQNLAAFGLSNDEGVYLMWARLAAEGYPLYSQTQAVQPPLFLETIGWVLRLGGQTIQAGRWAILVSFGFFAVILSGLAYRAGGRPAALTALFLLSLSPLVFTFSRLVMAEVPTTALAVTSVALFFLFLDKAHQSWLLASGLALGLSFIIKPLNPFIIGLIGLLLLIHYQPIKAILPSRRTKLAIHQDTLKFWQALLLNSFLWGLGLMIPLGGVLLLYEPVAVYDQLIRFRSDLRSAIPGSPAETWTQFEIFINSHWGFWLLAFGSIMAAVFRAGLAARRHFKIGSLSPSEPISPITQPVSPITPGVSPLPNPIYPLIWTIWLIAGVVMLWWHTPLFPHHFIVLLPPLILLGSDLIVVLISFWPKHEPANQQVGEADMGIALTPLPLSMPASIERYSLVIILSLLVAVAALNVPAMVQANQATAAIVTGGREAEALALLKAVSNPADFVMGDSQLLIFMADRRTPPPLGDVALVAIKAGRQTSANMIHLTETYQAPAVVQWSLRLPWLPEYLAWVEANYLTRRVWDNDHLIYFGQRWPSGQSLPHEQTVRLANSLVLRGYQLPAGPVKRGQELSLKLYWQTDRPVTRDYTVFVQLLNRQGVLVAGWDSQPLGGYFPTSQWPAREIITDPVRLPLPADLPAGDYTLITGMYLLETLERLRTVDGGSDYITLTTIKVEEETK